MLVIKLTVNISSGPRSQAYSSITLDQEMKPVPVRCLELGATLSHEGVISGFPDALPFISREPFIFLSPRHPQQSINQILPIEAENNSGMKT